MSVSRMTTVKVTKGFWKGCWGIVMGKTPLLPRYTVWLYLDSSYKIDDRFRSVPSELLVVPRYVTLWSFQMEVSIEGQPRPLTEEELTRQAILYIYEHRHDLLNPALYEKIYDKESKQEVPASWDKEKDAALKGILADVDTNQIVDVPAPTTEEKK